jgi:hypothetical protein
MSISIHSLGRKVEIITSFNCLLNPRRNPVPASEIIVPIPYRAIRVFVKKHGKEKYKKTHLQNCPVDPNITEQSR